MLNDPTPHPLLCIEEPENQLYPSLLPQLLEEFRLYGRMGGQVFITSHSPDFIDAAEIQEVFWLTKEKGYTKIYKAANDPHIKAQYEAGNPLGYLWKSKMFQGIDPE
jgi:predicted ATPase